MKKTILLLMLAVTVAATATTPDKKKKKTKTSDRQETLAAAPQTLADSLSYAAGQNATVGLAEFIKREYGVDTTHFADFIEGYREALTSLDDPKYAARNAGIQIAKMTKERILPQIQQQFKDTQLSIGEQQFNNGFIAAIQKDTTIMTLNTAESLFKTTLEAEKEKQYQQYRTENELWLAENAKKEGVVTLPSGLQYKIITEGTGDKPTIEDKVTVKYEGKLIDGTEFDSSYKRNPQTTSFGVSQVIKGWTEALTLMPTGSKWEVYIPQELGYGARQAGKIKPYSTLIFTVELVEIVKK